MAWNCTVELSCKFGCHDWRSCDLKILEKKSFFGHLYFLAKMSNKTPKRNLSDTETLTSTGLWGMTRAYLLRACWRLHIPWLPEETKRKGRRGRRWEKNVAPKASSTWVVWWLSMQFFETCTIFFVGSFSMLWLGSSMVHPVHPDSFTCFWCKNYLHTGTLPYCLATRFSHVLWTPGRSWDGRWVRMGGNLHDVHDLQWVKLKTWIV